MGWFESPAVASHPLQRRLAERILFFEPDSSIASMVALSVTISHSGELTRHACWRWCPLPRRSVAKAGRHRELSAEMFYRRDHEA